MADSVCILLFNSKNELLIQVRSKDEKDYPLHWDFSAAGSVELNETPSFAAKRELREELGLNLNLEPLFEVNFKRQSLILYKGFLDEAPSDFGHEVEEVFFMSLESLIQKQDKEKLHPEFKYVLDEYLTLDLAESYQQG